MAKPLDDDELHVIAESNSAILTIPEPICDLRNFRALPTRNPRAMTRSFLRGIYLKELARLDELVSPR